MQDDHVEPGLGDVVSGLPKEEGSLLDSLAEQRKEIAEHRETDIPIQGYVKVPLYARYRIVDGAELDRIGVKISREFKGRWDRNFYGSIDAFIVACVGIYYDHPETGERTQLTYQGRPITGYTQDLAAALRFEDKIDPQHPARSIVLGVFGNNEIAISSHNIMLGRWMGNTALEVTQEFLAGNL